jgi:hypothetical protein
MASAGSCPETINAFAKITARIKLNTPTQILNILNSLFQNPMPFNGHIPVFFV